MFKKQENAKNNNIRKDGLHTVMICMTLLPMVILGVIIVAITAHRYTATLNDQVARELRDVGRLMVNSYELMYPGDFGLIVNDPVTRFVKGDTDLTGQFEIVDSIKAQTDVDVTLFYNDIRVATTLCDTDGKRIVGTSCSSLIYQQVHNRRKAKFYTGVDIFGTKYFSYYEPIYNSEGKTIGMIFAGCPSESVQKEIIFAILPVIIIEIVGIVLVTWICLQWTGNLIEHLQVMKKFLVDMTGGKLTGDLESPIVNRTDEIGEMGRAMLHMQNSVRNLIEKDTLTGLRNRRYGNIRLQEIQDKARENNTDFAVAIGDIDFFKKINDTYGHECGDVVLKTVAETLQRGLRGNGFAARWGGEEFLMVFQYVGAEAAENQLNTIRTEIENLRVPYGELIVKLTMSIGVTEGCTACRIDELVKAADDRLYYAKENGRNQVVRILPKTEVSDEVE